MVKSKKCTILKIVYYFKYIPAINTLLTSLEEKIPIVVIFSGQSNKDTTARMS